MQQILIDEIFDIEHKPTDVLIEHFCEIMQDCGFDVNEVNNYDTVVYVSFCSELGLADITGTLAIHRMYRKFEVAAKLMFHDRPKSPITYTGFIDSDFNKVSKYLFMLRYDGLQLVEQQCIKRKNYRWRGLRFEACK